MTLIGLWVLNEAPSQPGVLSSGLPGHPGRHRVGPGPTTALPHPGGGTV